MEIYFPLLCRSNFHLSFFVFYISRESFWWNECYFVNIFKSSLSASFQNLVERVFLAKYFSVGRNRLNESLAA